MIILRPTVATFLLALGMAAPALAGDANEVSPAPVAPTLPSPSLSDLSRSLQGYFTEEERDLLFQYMLDSIMASFKDEEVALPPDLAFKLEILLVRMKKEGGHYLDNLIKKLEKDLERNLKEKLTPPDTSVSPYTPPTPPVFTPPPALAPVPPQLVPVPAPQPPAMPGSLYPLPTYPASSYPASAFQVPNYPAPAYQPPTYPAPAYQVPTYQPPTYQLPAQQAYPAQPAFQLPMFPFFPLPFFVPYVPSDP